VATLQATEHNISVKVSSLAQPTAVRVVQRRNVAKLVWSWRLHWWRFGSRLFWGSRVNVQTMVLCRVALTAEEVAAAVGQQAMVFHRVWVATTLTDSAEAAGGSRS
jgi:hypothetical protein